MKIAASGIFGLLIITTVLVAQKHDREQKTMTDSIDYDYIMRETIEGKLDFTAVLEAPGEVITHSNGIRFNKNDYHVFLWGEAVRKLGLASSDKAANLWEEIHGRKLTGPQRTALRIAIENKN